MLGLPNEILDIIIRLLVGEPVLNPPAYLQVTKQNNDIRALRLVNRRLALLGGPYLYFRHRLTSERQLTYETTHLTDVQKFCREKTRCVCARLPIMTSNAFSQFCSQQAIGARWSTYPILAQSSETTVSKSHTPEPYEYKAFQFYLGHLPFRLNTIFGQTPLYPSHDFE
jgi:hypothetical protein